MAHNVFPRRTLVPAVLLALGLAPACVGSVAGGGEAPPSEASPDAGGGDPDGDGDDDAPGADAAPDVEDPAGWNLTAADVGLAPHGLTCAGLPLYGGAADIPNGTTISMVRMVGDFDVGAGDIVLDRVCLQGRFTNIGNAGGPIVIRDSELDGTNASGLRRLTEQGAYQVTGSYIHDYTNGIHFKTFNPGDGDVIIERNVIEVEGNAIWVAGFVGDDTLADPVTGSVRENRLVGGSHAIYIYASGPVRHVSLERNLLSSPAKCTHFDYVSGGDVSDFVATDNRFAGSAINERSDAADWTTWADNFVLDMAAIDARGVPVAKP